MIIQIDEMQPVSAGVRGVSDSCIPAPIGQCHRFGCSELHEYNGMSLIEYCEVRLGHPVVQRLEAYPILDPRTTGWSCLIVVGGD